MRPVYVVKFFKQQTSGRYIWNEKFKNNERFANVAKLQHKFTCIQYKISVKQAGVRMQAANRRIQTRSEGTENM